MGVASEQQQAYLPTGKPMNPSVLFVTTVPVTLEVFLAPFARHFRQLGWRVDALSNGAASAESLAGSFDARYDVAWTRSPRSLLRILPLSRRVRELVTANAYDLVHVHTPIAAFVTRFALRRLPSATRPKVIYTAHGFHFYRGQKPLPHAAYRTMERAAARWTDYLVTINAEDHEAARSFGTIELSRVRLIPGIGVDPAPFAGVPAEQAAGVRRELGVAEDAFLLLMIAEFGAVKRHAHLLDALKLVRDARVVVVFVGDGPLEADVRARVSELELDAKVRFAGYRRDVPALLAAADALALVSEREGLPRSVLEGMAAGRAIIGTRTRGITDLVEPDSGWIAPKHDAEALARLIEDAAADPEECARRGAAGRARVLGTYALPLIIDAYEELYREALS